MDGQAESDGTQYAPISDNEADVERAVLAKGLVHIGTAPRL